MKNALNWLKGKNEYSLLIYAVLIWFGYPYLARLYDPTTIGLDPIFLQFVLYGIVAFCLIQTFTWIVIKTVWPALCDYFENKFYSDLFDLEKWQRIVLSVFIYCFIAWCLVTLSQNVLIK